jgi:hypothetical protein
MVQVNVSDRHWATHGHVTGAAAAKDRERNRQTQSDGRTARYAIESGATADVELR